MHLLLGTFLGPWSEVGDGQIILLAMQCSAYLTGVHEDWTFLSMPTMVSPRLYRRM